jgi:hypothetical protein
VFWITRVKILVNLLAIFYAIQGAALELPHNLNSGLVEVSSITVRARQYSQEVCERAQRTDSEVQDQGHF